MRSTRRAFRSSCPSPGTSRSCWPWHEQLAEHRRQVETELLAEQQRLARGELSPQEIERRRLERMEPGITRVEWSDDGAYVLDPVGAAAV